jgi:hypothetical protein
MPKERIETNAAKTMVVRVRCPARASLAEFEASIRAWVAHQCILLADFKVVSEANPVGLFDAEFGRFRDTEQAAAPDGISRDERVVWQSAHAPLWSIRFS